MEKVRKKEEEFKKKEKEEGVQSHLGQFAF